MAESRLLQPLRIGAIEVKHRVGMAPLTRLRATPEYVPTPLMKEYYGQRASEPGTLLISEGTFVSPGSGGAFGGAPGIWTEEQIAAWRTITDEVHSKGSFIYVQVAGSGRAAKDSQAALEGVEIVAPSAIPIDESRSVPRALTTQEVKETIQTFVTAAKNAIAAGFDGIEYHAANGYLLDQFLQGNSNQRTDEYGGSIENRSRMLLEILEGAAAAIGADRVGFRLSPWSTFQGMRMADPIPQFTDVITKANKLNLAYLHLVEARAADDDYVGQETLDFTYPLWNGPLLLAGGFTPASAKVLVDETHPDKDILVVFGRHFISNPDLVYRIRKGLELSAYHRDSFYTVGSPIGYSDYEYSPDYLASIA